MASDVMLKTIAGCAALEIGYHLISGDFFKAALIPLAGYQCYRLGKELDSELAQKIGLSIAAVGPVVFPASAIGFLVYEIGGKTMKALAPASIAGAFTTYTLFDEIIRAYGARG